MYYEKNRDRLNTACLARYHADPNGKRKNRERKRQRKRAIIAAVGLEPKCSKCGYDRSIAALDFHHTDPDSKKHNVSQIYGARIKGRWNLDEAVAEARKCILICANCHRELEEIKE